MNLLPIESVDVEAWRAANEHRRLTPWAAVRLACPKPHGFENVLEVLDDPGAWVLDSQAAKLYLVAGSERPADEPVVPLLPELVRVEARSTTRTAQDTPVRNLVFRD